VHELKGLGVTSKIYSYPQVQWGMTTWVQASSVHDTKYHEQCGDKQFHEGKAKQSLIFRLHWLYRVWPILKSSSLIVWPTIIYSSGHKFAWPHVVFVDQVGRLPKRWAIDNCQGQGGASENLTPTNLWLMYLK
jgi:hypothetical protein